MIERMTRAVQMDKTLFDDVRQDISLDTEARLVVVAVSAAEGIGTFLSVLFGPSVFGVNIISALMLGILFVVLGVVRWYLWSYLVGVVGAKVFNTTTEFGPLSRSLAYAYTPNIVQALTFVPVLGGLVGLVASIWSAVLGVFAVRQAMGLDTTKAIVTVVLAAILAGIAVLPFGLAAKGLGMF